MFNSVPAAAVCAPTSLPMQLFHRSFCHHHTQNSNTEVKLLDVSAALSPPSTGLQLQQSLFSCLGTADSQTGAVLAELSYTALPGMDLSSLLASWVVSTPRIKVASTQLQVDTTCPVVIDSLETDGCVTICNSLC